MNARLRRLFAALLIVAWLGVAARAEIIQWRGPDRSGIYPAQGLATAWPAEGPKQLWSAKTGIGYATPVGHDGKIYIFYLDESAGKDVLECLDAKTGKSIWKQSYDKGYTADFKGTRCTPVIEGERIYTYGGNSQLIAWNLADGKQIWSLDVLKETGGKNKRWGISSMPLIVGDVMYVQGGEGAAAAVCVEKATGKIVWKSEAQGGGYATPVLMRASDGPVLLCFGHEKLVGMNPKDGKTLWTLDEKWEIEWNVNATMPIVHEGKVFITCAYKNGHAGIYEVTAAGIKQVWNGKDVTARFQPGILEKGFVYVNSEGTLKCIDLNTGKVQWAVTNDRTLLGMGGSLVRFGDMLVLLSERGKLTLGKATPEKFEKISQVNKAVEGTKVWSSPLIYDGKLYLKGTDELLCYDISAK